MKSCVFSRYLLGGLVNLLALVTMDASARADSICTVNIVGFDKTLQHFSAQMTPAACLRVMSHQVFRDRALINTAGLQFFIEPKIQVTGILISVSSSRFKDQTASCAVVSKIQNQLEKQEYAVGLNECANLAIQKFTRIPGLHELSFRYTNQESSIELLLFTEPVSAEFSIH